MAMNARLNGLPAFLSPLSGGRKFQGPSVAIDPSGRNPFCDNLNSGYTPYAENIFSSIARDTRKDVEYTANLGPVNAIAVAAPPFSTSTLYDDEFQLDKEIWRLERLVSELSSAKSCEQKNIIISKNSRVVSTFGTTEKLYKMPIVSMARSFLTMEELYLLKCVVACGQIDLINVPYDWEVDELLVSHDDLSVSSMSTLKSAFSALGAMIEGLDVDRELSNFWDSSSGKSSNSNSSFFGGWENPGIFPSQLLQIIDFEGYGETMDAGFRDSQNCACLEPSDGIKSSKERLMSLISLLSRLEKFYDSVGGIIGYQLESLKLIQALKISSIESKLPSDGSLREPQGASQYCVPPGLDLSKETDMAYKAAVRGLKGMPDMAEVYPLGGSGDRLGLTDEKTGECLPVAMLPYCGRTLLEGLIRDLQAREYLHYRVYGQCLVTPVAIMTSAAKMNHQRVYGVCESHGWFGRGKDNFKLFEQPLVPTVAAQDGHWLASEHLTPVLKPGGHGAIWKLAKDEGVFDWFKKKSRKATLIRQISNPFAATDVTMLALSGIGLQGKKKFGFASCDRKVGAAEGVNVLVRKDIGGGKWECGITCVEYTEFEKLGISDMPVAPGSMRSQFPANSNILYADLAAVEHATSSSASATLPGLIMNLKKPVTYTDNQGIRHSVKAGRLECTMQNIADSLTDVVHSATPPQNTDDFSTFLVYNSRRKVTSSAKRRRKPDDLSLHQTPDGSVLDLQRNASELLSLCGISMPEMEGNQCYLEAPPPFMVLFHPALGPLWDVIRQKVRGGSMAAGSELQLEIAELYWNNVHVHGSLLVQAENVMGGYEQNDKGERILRYGKECGRCRMENVTVRNRGIDWQSASNVYWQHKVERFEALKVVLHADAEFDARDVTLQGDLLFEVPAGHKLTLRQGEAGLVQELVKLRGGQGCSRPSWRWLYRSENECRIVVELAE